jgi:hypothetical protein
VQSAVNWQKMKQRIYLDHAATTPILREARDAMTHAIEQWANPSSPHGEGRAARAILEGARTTIADTLGWRHDVIFTSGASESIEIVAKRAKVPGRAYGATEHPIVPHAFGAEARKIPVGRDGVIDEKAVAALLAEGPALIAIQQANNETGVIQPLDRLAPRIRDSARAGWRPGEGISAWDAGCALGCCLRGGACRATLRHGSFVEAAATVGGRSQGGRWPDYRRGRSPNPHDRLDFAAGRVQRVTAGPVRPRRVRGFRRQRLLVRQDEKK